MVRERLGVRNKARSGFSPKQLINGGSFGQDGGHRRQGRIGPRAEDEFTLGLVEIEASAEKPNGK